MHSSYAKMLSMLCFAAETKPVYQIIMQRNIKLNMAETKENEEALKITEARYLIVIPVMITIVCVIIDIAANIDDGFFDGMQICEIAENVFRTIIGYIFPSILSIVVAMLWQQRMERDDIYGIQRNKIGFCTIITVLYGAFFIVCLILYQLIFAVLFLISTIVYTIIIYNDCLNEKIKVKSKQEKSQNDFLIDYCKKT